MRSKPIGGNRAQWTQGDVVNHSSPDSCLTQLAILKRRTGRQDLISILSLNESDASTINKYRKTNKPEVRTT